MPKIFERDESLPENAWIASSSSVIDRGGAILTRPWKDVMGWDVGRGCELLRNLRRRFRRWHVLDSCLNFEPPKAN